jgi:hypothetical protein
MANCPCTAAAFVNMFRHPRRPPHTLTLESPCAAAAAVNMLRQSGSPPCKPCISPLRRLVLFWTWLACSCVRWIAIGSRYSLWPRQPKKQTRQHAWSGVGKPTAAYCGRQRPARCGSSRWLLGRGTAGHEHGAARRRGGGARGGCKGGLSRVQPMERVRAKRKSGLFIIKGEDKGGDAVSMAAHVGWQVPRGDWCERLSGASG